MLAAEELQEVRSLLKQPHVAARRVAVGIIATWRADLINQPSAQAILHAATGRYPCIINDANRPTELLVKLLWPHPHAVSAGAVVEAALEADLPARWALIQLLVLRHDAQGVQAVQFLLSIDGFVDLLSPPAASVFDSLLQHSAGEEHEQSLQLSSLASVFAGLLWRPGWTCEIAGFLQQLQQHDRLEGAAEAQVMAAASALASQVVGECNAAVGKPPAANSSDKARGSLRSLRSLARLLVSCVSADAHSSLYVMLGSADPLVSVIGAVALVDCGLVVGSDRIEVLARDPQTLAALFRGLDALGAAELISAQHRVTERLARAELVEWLSQESELGRAPDEIEFLGTWQLLDESDAALLGDEAWRDDQHDEVELFRFRVGAPHWSFRRGWMVGVAGALTHSCYSAEDEFTAEQHLQNLQVAFGHWPSAPPR